MRNFANRTKNHDWKFNEALSELVCTDYYYNGKNTRIDIVAEFGESAALHSSIVAELFDKDLLDELLDLGYEPYRPRGAGYSDIIICSTNLSSSKIWQKVREFSEALDDITN